MSFIHTVTSFESFDFDGYFSSVTAADIRASLNRDVPGVHDLLNLLSEKAAEFLEDMAQKANHLTCRHFGRTMGLYAPLYISDYCTNHCTYCGFNRSNPFRRRQLSISQIRQEAKVIADTGIRHILVLTGEAPDKTPLSYLEAAVRVLKEYFSSIALEIFPMDEPAYQALVTAGADSLTVYQETYDRKVYNAVHLAGKKADYAFRLETPERAASAGFRGINIGPLFGLADPFSEAFLAGIHARYLEQEFPDVEISLSLPRMTRALGGIAPDHVLSDTGFVRIMLAWRLFLPRAGITISTRESPAFRDRLIHLGPTRYSAGSKTGVGGYAANSGDAIDQFKVTDNRSVAEIRDMIYRSGYQPVFKDWERA